MDRPLRLGGCGTGKFLSILFMTLITASGLRAQPEPSLHSPSAVILNDNIQVVLFPGMPGSFLKVGGTVSLAVPQWKLKPNLLSRKPQIMVMGLSETGAILAQMPVVPFVEASSELALPLPDGSEARFLILQYPFSTMLQASEKMRWVCVESEKMRECIPAPSLNDARPLNRWQMPESKIELTSCTIYTERSGLAAPSIALTGVAEIVIPRMNDPYPMELPIRVSARNQAGNVLVETNLRAKIFFLRHAMVPNPAYKLNQTLIPPFLTVAIPLYIFSGSVTLPENLWEVTVHSDSPSYQVKAARKTLRNVDSNKDGAISASDDLNGDGVVNHGDWLGMIPAA